jgi:hypothetical protein
MSTQLQRAITAIKSGDKKTGKQLLTKALQADPRNEKAWLWLAHVVDSPKQSQECLERVLTINPQNENARRGLTKLNGSTAHPPPTRTDQSPAQSTAPTSVGATQPATDTLSRQKAPKPSAGYLGRSWLILFLVVALGILFGAKLIERWNMWAQLAQSGVTMRAPVVDLRTGDNETYYLTYRFEAPTAAGSLTEFEKEEQVSQEFYNLLKPGSLVKIQYIFENPAEVRLTGSDSLNNLVFWTVLALVTGAVGLWGLTGMFGRTIRWEFPRFKRAPAKPKVVWEGEGPPPLKQWAGTYTLGQDNYEGFFVIETDDGIFLGEGGMEIFKTVPHTNPKQPIAFDVGLFDKTDITTLSRVVMTEHAYQDETLRASVEANPHAEAILAEPGATFTMTSTAMRVEAKIEDMEYSGENGNVYFNRLTVSLAIFVQEGVDLAQPMEVPDQYK